MRFQQQGGESDCRMAVFLQLTSFVFEKQPIFPSYLHRVEFPVQSIYRTKKSQRVSVGIIGHVTDSH